MKKVFDTVHGADRGTGNGTAGSRVRGGRWRGSQGGHRGGIWTGLQVLHSRVGHGIGMDGHEWPYLVRGNRRCSPGGMLSATSRAFTSQANLASAWKTTCTSRKMERSCSLRRVRRWRIRLARVKPALCHPERSPVHSLANGTAESKDLYHVEGTSEFLCQGRQSPH